MVDVVPLNLQARYLLELGAVGAGKKSLVLIVAGYSPAFTPMNICALKEQLSAVTSIHWKPVLPCVSLHICHDTAGIAGKNVHELIYSILLPRLNELKDGTSWVTWRCLTIHYNYTIHNLWLGELTMCLHAVRIVIPFSVLRSLDRWERRKGCYADSRPPSLHIAKIVHRKSQANTYDSSTAAGAARTL